MPPGSGAFHAEIVADGEDAVIVAHGEVDIATAATLGAAIDEGLATRPARLVLDASDVTFLDSTGLSTLVRAYRALPAGCPMVLRRPSPRVAKVLGMTGVDTLFVVEG